MAGQQVENVAGIPANHLAVPVVSRMVRNKINGLEESSEEVQQHQVTTIVIHEEK